MIRRELFLFFDASFELLLFEVWIWVYLYFSFCRDASCNMVGSEDD